MAQIDLFAPVAPTVALSCSTSSARAALTAPLSRVAATVRVANPGAVVAFIRFLSADSGSSATTDMPILPGATECFALGRDWTHVAGITSSGSTTLYFTTGEGA